VLDESLLASGGHYNKVTYGYRKNASCLEAIGVSRYPEHAGNCGSRASCAGFVRSTILRIPRSGGQIMLRPVALLACQTSAGVKAVREVFEMFDYLQFDVCSSMEQMVGAVGHGNVALAVADLGAIGEHEGAIRLLNAMADSVRPSPTVFLCDRHDEILERVLRRSGAVGLLELPRDLSRLYHCVRAVTLSASLPPQAAVGKRAASPVPTDEEQFANLVTVDMEDLMRQVRRIAPQDSTVLLTGETGTGKTALARLIHDMSPRRKEPFVVIDFGSMSAGVIESELFGHAKGAFTGADRDRTGLLAAAGKGTVLLDEVNALPLHLQAKLLQVVEDKCFKVVGSVRTVPMEARLIAASNVPLQELVDAKQFRQDLYYRLNVVEFYLPPLRERRAAIGPIAQRFLDVFASRNQPGVRGFRPEVLEALACHTWPGNIRELRNVVERAIALCEGEAIGLADIPQQVLGEPTCDTRRPARECITLGESRAEAERLHILEALEKNRNNRLRTAKELGISRMGLYKKMHQYGLMTHVKPVGAGRREARGA
jgi:DNA-binding NtrC family response regulator